MASKFPVPRIVSHEGVGEHLKKDDVVGVPLIQKTCLHCEFCLSSRETLCANKRLSSVSASGCFAECFD